MIFEKKYFGIFYAIRARPVSFAHQLPQGFYWVYGLV